MTNVRSASSSAIGIDGEVVSGCRVEKIEGEPTTSAGIRGQSVENSAATGMLVDPLPKPPKPAPATAAPPAADSFPEGMTRREFRAQAGDVLNELRILASAIDQWAIENNKRSSDRPELKDLAPLVSRISRLRAELDAGRCVDSIGNPIRLGTVDDLPALSPRTAAYFALVANPDFWKPFPLAD